MYFACVYKSMEGYKNAKSCVSPDIGVTNDFKEFFFFCLSVLNFLIAKPNTFKIKKLKIFTRKS